MFISTIKGILKDERGVEALETIGIVAIALVFAMIVYNNVGEPTKNLYSNMVNKTKDITSTGF